MAPHVRRKTVSDFAGHPVATASQHEQELAALELTAHPTVRAAYRSVAENWLARAKASDAMRARFDDAFAEVMFSAAVWSSNQDKLRPKVSCITRLGSPRRGPRDSRITLGHRQSRQRLPGDSDLRRRALRDPRTRRREPDDGELLHAVGREHGHRRRAQRAHHGGRFRRVVPDHRRFRPRGRSAQPRPDHTGSARVLHPRRAAQLGPRRPESPHRATYRRRHRQPPPARSTSRPTPPRP